MKLLSIFQSVYMNVWRFIDSHGTKVIGFVTGTISAIASVSGLIPEFQLKYYMAVIAVLTFWRGFINQGRSASQE